MGAIFFSIMHIDWFIHHNVNFMSIDEVVHNIIYNNNNDDNSNNNKMQYKLNHDPFVFPWLYI